MRVGKVTVGTRPNLQQLMSLVGHFLLRWGGLENGLAGAPIPQSLERVRHMRNAICHRLVSAHADPTSETEAHIFCRLLNETIVRYTASDLEGAIRDLERIGH